MGNKIKNKNVEEVEEIPKNRRGPKKRSNNSPEEVENTSATEQPSGETVPAQEAVVVETQQAGQEAPQTTPENIPISQVQEETVPEAPAIPAEMLSNTIPSPAEPIAEEVVNKEEYTTIRGSKDPGATPQDKKEESGTQTQFKESAGSSGATTEPKTTPADLNSQTDQTADFVFDIYGQAKSGIRGIAKFEMNGLRIRHDKEEIDLNQVFSGEDDEETVTLRSVIETVNKQMDKDIVLKEGFREKYKPALMRVLSKHGLIMSDEWYLIQGFGTDMITDFMEILGLRRNVSNLLEYSGEILKNQKIILKNQEEAERRETKKHDIEEQLRHDNPPANNNNNGPGVITEVEIIPPSQTSERPKKDTINSAENWAAESAEDEIRD